jgi:hypothetical protein
MFMATRPLRLASSGVIRGEASGIAPIYNAPVIINLLSALAPIDRMARMTMSLDTIGFVCAKPAMHTTGEFKVGLFISRFRA